jgi:hypothetical protein
VAALVRIGVAAFNRIARPLSTEFCMLDAAQSIGDDPDRISFTATVRIIRRKLLQGSFSPLNEQGGIEEEL